MKIGCDLVLIDRIARLAQNEGFLNKVFHPDELSYCSQRGVGREASLAARFAAKEAFGKALGTGIFSQGVLPNEICVQNNCDGCPSLHLSLALQEKMASMGLLKCEVSLSHQGEYALATVLLF
jgi:holo-[acyl-carrier protein] synthase